MTLWPHVGHDHLGSRGLSLSLEARSLIQDSRGKPRRRDESWVRLLEAVLRFHELPLPRLPAEGGLLENWQISRRLDYAKRNHLVLRVPKMDRVLDEYSSVPFLSEDGRVFLYDSSSLGHWLDSRATEERSLLYPGDPALRFIAQLIDEAAFEKSRALSTMASCSAMPFVPS